MIRVRTYENSRVESAHRKVKLYRYETLDVVVSYWRRRTHISVYVHGKLSDPMWLRVRTSDGKLWEVDARDMDVLMMRDPQAQLILDRVPEPWCVIVQKAVAVMAEVQAKTTNSNRRSG
jgi:hypothetical protein